eukprot:ANDGO_07707.mRNA.1 hypothetical protein
MFGVTQSIIRMACLKIMYPLWYITFVESVGLAAFNFEAPFWNDFLFGTTGLEIPAEKGVDDPETAPNVQVYLLDTMNSYENVIVHQVANAVLALLLLMAAHLGFLILLYIAFAIRARMVHERISLSSLRLPYKAWIFFRSLYFSLVFGMTYSLFVAIFLTLSVNVQNRSWIEITLSATCIIVYCTLAFVWILPTLKHRPPLHSIEERWDLEFYDFKPSYWWTHVFLMAIFVIDAAIVVLGLYFDVSPEMQVCVTLVFSFGRTMFFLVAWPAEERLDNFVSTANSVVDSLQLLLLFSVVGYSRQNSWNAEVAFILAVTDSAIVVCNLVVSIYLLLSSVLRYFGDLLWFLWNLASQKKNENKEKEKSLESSDASQLADRFLLTPVPVLSKCQQVSVSQSSQSTKSSRNSLNPLDSKMFRSALFNARPPATSGGLVAPRVVPDFASPANTRFSSTNLPASSEFSPERCLRQSPSPMPVFGTTAVTPGATRGQIDTSAVLPHVFVHLPPTEPTLSCFPSPPGRRTNAREKRMKENNNSNSDDDDDDDNNNNNNKTSTASAWHSRTPQESHRCFHLFNAIPARSTMPLGESMGETRSPIEIHASCLVVPSVSQQSTPPVLQQDAPQTQNVELRALDTSPLSSAATAPAVPDVPLQTPTGKGGYESGIHADRGSLEELARTPVASKTTAPVSAVEPVTTRPVGSTWDRLPVMEVPLSMPLLLGHSTLANSQSGSGTYLPPRPTVPKSFLDRSASSRVPAGSRSAGLEKSALGSANHVPNLQRRRDSLIHATASEPSVQTTNGRQSKAVGSPYRKKNV